MTQPPARPVVLDSSVLVAYERMQSTGTHGLREPQYRVAGWLLDGRQLLVPALSLTVASRECGADLPELDYLLAGDSDQVYVVPLNRTSAVQVGAVSKTGDDLEIAHVVWCAGAGRWPRSSRTGTRTPASR